MKKPYSTSEILCHGSTKPGIIAMAIFCLCALNSHAATMIDPAGITPTASDVNGASSGTAFTLVGTVNGSGLISGGANDGLHDGNTADGREWYTNIGQVKADTWISWDLGDSYILDSIKIWNASRFIAYGIQDVDIYVSDLTTPGDPEAPADTDWNLIGSAVTLPQANETSSGSRITDSFDLETATGIALPSTAVRHVRFEVISTYEGTGNGYTGLAEIQFYQVPEPSSSLLMAFGATLMLVRRRH